MKKVLLVATVYSHICQFHKPLVEMLHANGIEVHVAGHDNLALKNGLKLDFVDKAFDIPFARSPFSKSNIKAYKMLKKVIDEGGYDIVHCNTPVGGLLTRLVCKKIKKNKPYVIYEAHGFHFYKGSSKKNWLLYYPIEKHFAKSTDTLITITHEDYELSKKKFKTNTVLVHGVGILTKKYKELSAEEKSALRKEYGFNGEDKLLLCTGELNKNKNQATVIKAMQEVVKTIPSAKLLLAGNGPEKEELQSLVNDLKLENNVVFLGYRTDLEKFANICDLVVSCSLREGLPMNICEAMYLGKPIIVSSNRGHRELIEDGVTGYVVSAYDVNAFSEKTTEILSNSELAEKMGGKAKEKATLYTDEKVKKELEEIYKGIIG